MKVAVDEERCRGHGMCLTLCPEVFQLTDDGYAVATSAMIPAHLEKAASDAVDNCPEQAIIVTDTDKET